MVRTNYPNITISIEYDFPTYILPRRHYNAPCRVNRCHSVIALTTMERNIRDSVICELCYTARKIIVNAWKKYIYTKRLRMLFLITQRLFNHNQTDINKLIADFLV